MALTATFRADFGDFYDAVQKATVELKKLGDTTKPVEVALNRMVDNFSGRKMIQETTLLVEAVNKLEGGLSNLTRKELTALAARVDETTEKMQKMGVAVPDAFRKVQEAAAQAKPATESWTASFGKLQTVVQGLLALQVVQWVIGFGREVLATADTLTRLSAQTGVSVQWLQKFQVAGDDAGNTVEELASAVSQMQKRLAGDDESAVAALRSMQLTLSDLKGMSPEQQFVAIADAIAKIEDPAEQARVATELFGQAGARILPTIKRGFDDVKDAAVGMSDDTVTALDEIGDGMGTLWRETKTFVGTSIAYFYEYAKAAKSTFTGKLITDAQKNYADLGKEIDTQLTLAAAGLDKLTGLPAGLPAIKPMVADLNLLDRQIDRSIQTNEKAATATAKLGKETADTKQEMIEQARAANVLGGQIRGNLAAYTATIESQKGMISWSEKALADNAAIGAKIRSQSAALLQADVTEQSQFFRDTFAYLEKLPDAFVGPINEAKVEFQSFGKFIATSLPQSILSAVQGGGSVLQSIGGTIGNYLLDPNQSGIGKAITTGASKLPGLIGNAVSSVLPGVGALIGPAIEGVKKLFGKMFGAEQKEVNKFRDTFVQAAAGINELNKQAQAAGLSLDNLLGAKKKSEYEAAANALTTAFQFQKDAMATLDETAKRYGFTLQELGPALARQELDKQAQQLFKDWQVLNAAGIDTIAITTRMSEAMNTYVTDALAMGSEVPIAMKPMIEQMIQMGTLTDASGNKIESLETSGISFAMTMSEGFKSLIAEVTKLTDAIARGLGLAINQTSSNLKAMPKTMPVNIVYNDPGYNPGYRTQTVPGYQEGTGGKYVDFGQGTLAMLHGKEAIVPAGDRAPMAAGGPGGGPAAVSVTINAQGAFFDTPGDLQRLADKVNEALTAKFGLRNSMRAA